MASLPTRYTAHRVALDPRGRFVFASSLDEVFSYRVNEQSGALQEAPWPTSFPEPMALAADPGGRFLYVGGYNELAVFAIDAEHGGLPTPAWPFAGARRVGRRHRCRALTR